MEETVKKIFRDRRAKVLTLQEIYRIFAQSYALSDHQLENHPKYPQPNYYHEIRSIIAKLVNEGYLEHGVERGTYQLKSSRD